ncbi:pentatricopeptide repeat-containing protein At5g28460-like [Chenopodium quinoa]|uniref:Pentatricopeptide repeat-containing protein n=1 Tax=Chenopodium quinoa TaxID=63459 RepID=A0A803KZF3_CHEQI|nr:pentatricopeptide repeat-containing protein At5g28460-like [Chenopodium quinoa]
MSIASRAPICSKLLRLLKHQNPQIYASFLHSSIEKPYNAEPPKVDSSSSSSIVTQIVEILKSNDNENWKTNQQLSNLLFSDSNSLSSNHILQITRRLGDSSTALNFVEHLRSNSPCPDDNLLSSAFQAVFELASRKPSWKEKLFDLLNTSKEMGVPLTVNSVILFIQCLGRVGIIEELMIIYDELESQMKNTHVRNVVIDQLFRNGRFDDALQVLDDMLQPNVNFPPNSNTAAIVFSVMLEARKHGKGLSWEELVELALKFGRHRVFPDTILLTRWINELCRTREIDLAWKLLYAFMELDGPVEVAPYNALLTGLAKDRQFKRMEVLLEDMLAKGISANVVTLGISINHLCKSFKIDEAINLFEKMRSGKIGAHIEPDVIIYNTLINGLCKAGRTEEGLAMMRKMISEGKCSPISSTYNCLIDGFCKVDELERSLELFDEMEKQGVQPNVVTINTLVGGMCRDGKAGNALKFYRQMEGKGLKGNKVTYTTLISGFCGVNNINKAMELFKEIRQTCALDAIVYYSLISGLSQAGLMDDVESVLFEMKSAGFLPDIRCYNVMINGFCKKNKLDKAHQLMEEMKEVGLEPDSITYNTLISYFSRTGDLKPARRLLIQMVENKIAPTVVTFGALIYACCRAGELDEAMKIFRKMSSSTRTPPNTVVYNVLIDALCQKNELGEALSLFEDMIAKGVGPDSSTFNALFKGLRDQNKLDKALELMGKMTELACHPDYITMEVLTEWLPAAGEDDKLKQFVEGYR